jgi:hypothetical protein
MRLSAFSWSFHPIMKPSHQYLREGAKRFKLGAQLTYTLLAATRFRFSLIPLFVKLSFFEPRANALNVTNISSSKLALF